LTETIVPPPSRSESINLIATMYREITPTARTLID
jgi:hypothetical protein